VQVRDVDDSEAGCAGGRGLEEAGEETVATGEGGDSRIVELTYLVSRLPIERTCYRKLTSRIMKKMTSMPFSRTRIQNNHQFALLGKSSVKHRRG
jgi:hypothetical protein